MSSYSVTFAPWGNVPHHLVQQPTQRGHGTPDIQVSAIDVWHQRLCPPASLRFEREELLVFESLKLESSKSRTIRQKQQSSCLSRWNILLNGAKHAKSTRSSSYHFVL
jgi:hypothetical protein